MGPRGTASKTPPLTLDARRRPRGRRERLGKPQALPLRLEIAFGKRIDAMFERIAAKALARATARVQRLTHDAEPPEGDDRTALARELTATVDFGVKEASELVTEVANENARQMRRAIRVEIQLPERPGRIRRKAREPGAGRKAVREAAKEVAIQVPELSPKNVRSLATRTVREVKGIAQSVAERVESAVTRAVTKGIRGEELAKELERILGIEKKAAKRVAVGQVIRINSEVTQQRHEALGITEYIWRATPDEHTRRWHRKLDKTRQRYDSPPVGGGGGPKDRGHPGSADVCRCQAIPVIP